MMIDKMKMMNDNELEKVSGGSALDDALRGYQNTDPNAPGYGKSEYYITVSGIVIFG